MHDFQKLHTVVVHDHFLKLYVDTRFKWVWDIAVWQDESLYPLQSASSNLINERDT